MRACFELNPSSQVFKQVLKVPTYIDKIGVFYEFVHIYQRKPDPGFSQSSTPLNDEGLNAKDM